MIDELIIQGKSYRITDSPYDCSISLIKSIDEIIPEKSFYRNPKTEYKYDDILAGKVLHLVTGLDREFLAQAENLSDIHFKFTHRLVFHIYNPEPTGEMIFKKFKPIADIYENESIHAFAEACDLIAAGNSIQVAEYILAVYLRKRKEKYSELLAKSRLEFFESFTYDYFAYLMSEHNETSATIRQLHSKIFEGTGEGKSMAALISQVAERGVFTEGGKTAIQCARNVPVGKFFDYVETIS
jgi:hypothetical protein